MQKLKSPAAFTLIEMLISITIFMIFIGIVGSSYISLVRANRSANELQKIYRDVRFIFDTIAAEVHSGRIDYSCEIPAIRSTDSLCFENIPNDKKLIVMSASGLKRTTFKIEGNRVRILKQIRDTAAAVWSAKNWEDLSSPMLSLDAASLSVFPLSDPYSFANAAIDEVQWQPRVTVSLSTKQYLFKTTYSSRSYGKAISYK